MSEEAFSEEKELNKNKKLKNLSIAAIIAVIMVNLISTTWAKYNKNEILGINCQTEFYKNLSTQLF
jgi:hypothetical protein